MIVSIFRIIGDILYPKRIFSIQTDASVTLCEKIEDKDNLKSVELAPGVGYHNPFNYQRAQYNKVASKVFGFRVYGDAYVETQVWNFEERLKDYPPLPEIVMDKRLVKLKNSSNF
jgi:hypothetical protein